MGYASRPPAVAGAFYPADPRVLGAVVDELLEDARDDLAGRSLPADPTTLIVPHAGYIYSGSTAALAYAALDRRRTPVDRVVLLGPAHRVALRGLGRSTASAFDTPLGPMPLAPTEPTWAELPQVVAHDETHRGEHALEVQLPFLRTVLGPVPIVPLVIGRASPAEVADVIAALRTPGTLVVVSTDLSHYHPSDLARRLDAGTIERILDLDDTIEHDHACGATPLNGLLAERRRAVTTRPDPGLHLLAYRHSGDTAGDNRRVVGYASFVGSQVPGRAP